jgi:hypothetical protein
MTIPASPDDSATVTPTGPDTDVAEPTSASIEAPTKADGTLFAYELIHAGGTRRAYADDLADLTNVLLPGYENWTEKQRWEARLHLAIRAQVVVQAEENATDAFRTLPAAAQAVLMDARHEPPTVASWSHPVPLVLVASFYAPAGQVPRPVREQGMAPNVIWIDPSDEVSLLTTLHDAGFISLNTSLDHQQ